MTIGKCARTFVLVVLLMSSAAHARTVVDTARSPVFKGYAATPGVPFLTPSDATSKMIQTFQLVQRANAGDVVAQHELGLRHLFGRGADADTLRAAYWMMRAASKSFLPARYNLGILQIEGIGLDWNPFEAYKSFLFCGERGMPEAEFQIGIMLTNNLIVPQDLKKAREWIAMAADSNYAPAIKVLNRLDEYLQRRQESDTTARIFDPVLLSTTDNEEVTDSTKLEKALRDLNDNLNGILGYQKLSGKVLADSMNLMGLDSLARQGVPEVMTLLGRVYERGTILRRDLIKSASYYIRGIRLDSYQATRLLLHLLDQPEFYRQLKKRADANDSDALFVWAGLKILGFDGKLFQNEAFITEAQAVQMLDRAVGQKSAFALEEVGLLRYGGKWVPKDQEVARQKWLESAKLGNTNALARLSIVSIRSTTDDKDRAEAVGRLFRLSEKGSLLASVGLGFCYEEGKGVARNTALAARLYRAAAQRGSQDAIQALIRLYDSVRPDEDQFQTSE